MKFRYLSLSISILFISTCFFYTYKLYGGLKYGLDFSGGIRIELKTTLLNSEQISKNKKTAISLEALQNFFKKEKLLVSVAYSDKRNKNLLKIEMDSQLEQVLEKQAKKNEAILFKNNLAVSSVDYLEWKLSEYFKIPIKEIQFTSIDKIGPTVGDYLKESSIKLMLIALLIIVIYVSFRFKFNFAVGAMIALLHDLLATVALLGILQIPVSVPVVAALLTILGYSINDTIVIFDRVRENVHDIQTPIFQNLVIKSIWQSLTRTIVTSVTTLIAVVTIFLWSGETLKDMSFVLILGVIVGTYSSSFIACPVVVLLTRIRKP